MQAYDGGDSGLTDSQAGRGILFLAKRIRAGRHLNGWLRIHRRDTRAGPGSMCHFCDYLFEIMGFARMKDGRGEGWLYGFSDCQNQACTDIDSPG